MRIATIATLVGGAMLAAVPAGAASMSTGWTEISMTQDNCVAVASRGIQGLGMRPDVVDNQTIFGWQGDLGVAVRCIASRNLAVLFSYHSTDQGSRDWVEALRAAFTGGGGAPQMPRGKDGDQQAPAPVK